MVTAIADREILQDLIHFQQDRTPPHYHWKVRQFLDDQLPGHWVGQAEPIPWPPRSPDLNPLEFFQGYVKEHIYILPLPRTVSEMKECISETIAPVNADMLSITWQ
jgi:hypothetical protein